MNLRVSGGMFMKKSKRLTTLMLVVCMALSTFLSACGNAPQSERSESSVKKSVVVDRKDIDFEDLNTEDVKTSIEKYSKDLGIPRVKEIDIYWRSEEHTSELQ